MTIHPAIKRFHQRYILEIGETLEDFYGDYIWWKKFHHIFKPDSQAFPEYAEWRIQKWTRLAEQEGHTFKR